MLIDTHIHLNLDAFRSDRDMVIRRAREAGIERMITIGTDLQSSRISVELADAYPGVFAAAGIHPHEALKTGDRDLQEIENLLSHSRVVAAGEIGLDYYYDFSPPEPQKILFNAQLRIARKKQMPVIIHVREAMADALACIDRAGSSPWRGVFHCFGGSETDVPAVLERGFHISFTGVVTFKNFKQLEAVRRVPLERLVLETDAPYMTPVPHRGKRNEPKFLPFTAERIAAIRNIPVALLIEKTTENALQLFSLKEVS